MVTISLLEKARNLENPVLPEICESWDDGQWEQFNEQRRIEYGALDVADYLDAHEMPGAAGLVRGLAEKIDRACHKAINSKVEEFHPNLFYLLDPNDPRSEVSN